MHKCMIILITLQPPKDHMCGALRKPSRCRDFQFHVKCKKVQTFSSLP